MHVHGHPHSHGHAHGSRAANRTRLTITLVLSAAYLVAEVIGGLLTNSLALLADAGHMLSDVGALALSLFAIWLADRPSPVYRTFGYYRGEILAALVNGAALVVIAVFIVIEAFRRIGEPPEVQGGLMLAVAAIGLVVNLIGLALLHQGREESLNVRGAWLHVLMDALGSVGAMAAAGLIWAFEWYWADPVASIAIALMVVYSSWHLLAEAVSVLMESAPRGIDVDEVRASLLAVPGVYDIHDLHIWSITSGHDALSVHIVKSDDTPHARLLTNIRQMLHARFGIDTMTVQIEPDAFQGCSGAS